MYEIIKRYGSIAVLSISFLLINLPDINSQKVELSPFFGYQTAARFPRDENYMRIGGGIDYGVSLNYAVSPKWRLEISCNQVKSDISHPPISMYDRHSYNKYSNLKSRFLSLGGLKEFGHGNTLHPFGIMTAGWVHYHPTSNGYYNGNLLHFSLGGGVKIAVTDNFGLRFQARLILPVWLAHGYFASDYSGPLLAPVHTTIIAQGDFTLGAYVVLAKSNERVALRL